MVPSGWDSKELRELVTFSNGKGHEKHISEGGKYVVVNSKYISSDGSVFKRSDESFCPASTNDILMVMSDVPNGKAIAKCFLVDEDNKYTVNQRIARFRSKGSDPLFLFYSINRNSYYLEFDDGLKQTNLRKDDVLDCPIKTPPLPEQRKIAKILSTWDKAISTTEKLIETSKQQKKALMQQLLTGKKRLVSPETGKAFEGEWEEVHLKDICDVNPKKPKEPENGLVSFVPMDAVSEDAKLLRTDDKPYSEVSKGFTSFKDLDTLIAKITPCFENGKGALVNHLKNGIGFGSTEFHVLRAKRGNSPDFIYYLTTTSAFRVRGEMNMQGSAGQKRVTTDYLKLYKVVVPKELNEQQKIASVITAADKEIEVLEAKLAHFKQEKKALMQQLLTGKRRVKVDEEVAA
ncbi:TPA: restriction endonuclease subunit S [Vibrio parahaemolyticus]